MRGNSAIHNPIVRASIARAIRAARNFERLRPFSESSHRLGGHPSFLFGYLKQEFDFFVEERNDKERAVIAAMLNANVALNAVSDNANVPNALAWQARLDAIALSEAIQLLKPTLVNAGTPPAERG